MRWKAEGWKRPLAFKLADAGRANSAYALVANSSEIALPVLIMFQ
jgi:hypothetical protein